MNYTYSITDDTLNGIVDTGTLRVEIENSSIIIAIDRISTSDDDLNITFKANLGSADETILDDLVSNHEGADSSDDIQHVLIDGVEVDSEGRQIQRMAAGKKGWTYMAHPIEITTSTISGCYSSDFNNNPRTDFDMKLYNAEGDEIIDQPTADTDCVKTVLTFKPNYDYEIISGNVFQAIVTTKDIRIWTIGGAFSVVDNSPIFVKEFISGINFKYIGNDDHIETDGRASKLMVKDITSKGLPFPTYQGNCFQFIIRHPVGEKHSIMTMLEYFRE